LKTSSGKIISQITKKKKKKKNSKFIKTMKLGRFKFSQ